ncbi:MAG: formimidoylglutamate deiminase [Flavobacteriales bacterium]|nr:formimidoylglutamate deiminase [Flavobacteriales bacterium]
MTTYRFKYLLTEEGWKSDALVKVDTEGKILSLTEDQSAIVDHELNVAALPGFQNAHSHSFQYAMAGLAERHSTSSTPDDFWSWREAMYSLALSINPDQLESIARMLYSEMLRHGYTDVAEFHYVHHDKNGSAYENLSEMGERLVKAAADVGLGITLIPIFYQKGGFGKEPTEGQKRFISSDLDAYNRLLDASEKSTELYQHANLSIGIHSMRGVEPAVIKQIAEEGRKDIPFHIHISEQLKEIEDSIAYLGKRPVEWMLDEVEMNERFHLVHATHLTEGETLSLAKTDASVVLCPSTEGNLGDGIFPLRSFQEAGGKWSIGTDSHVGLNPLEELRILDYGQRLISHKRNTYYSQNEGDSGLYAYQKALMSGREAMNNFTTSYFAEGTYLDVALFNLDTPLLSVTNPINLASTILYSTDASHQYGTIAKGKLQVVNGRHVKESEILEDFKNCMKQLANR